MLQTRPEKAEAMTRIVYELRNVAAKAGREGDLNLAEVLNAFGQAYASVIAGAYNAKSREVILDAIPHLIRAYFPQWDRIYHAHGHTP